MTTTAPSKLRIAVMVAFAASCVGLLLFLWISFGGSVPLAPQAYRFSVEFNQAVQLGTQADVEIAGVDVGRVVSVGLDRNTGRTRAVIEIFPSYAPRPADTRAILRAKTLLGETYVELSFGNPHGPMLGDGATLPQAQVAPTVQLDEILNTFDPKTRAAFKTWMQGSAVALSGRGEAFNAAFAELYPFATNVASVLAVLRRDHAATRLLLSDGARVLHAAAASPSALQGMIRNSDSVFAATAARDRELAEAVRAFPPFLIGARQTVSRVKRFAQQTNPLVDELRPAARQLTPALISLEHVAPQLRALMVGLGPLSAASIGGVPALERLLAVTAPLSAASTKPLLGALTPYLGNLVPVIDYVNTYRREVAAFFANGAASTNATALNFAGTRQLHYLRTSTPVGPESLAAYGARPGSNRSNPYMAPGSDSNHSSGYMTLLNGALHHALQVFGSYLCGVAPTPTISPALQAALSPSLYRTLKRAYYGGGYPSVPHPACNAQAPLGVATGVSGAFYPRLQPLP